MEDLARVYTKYRDLVCMDNDTKQELFNTINVIADYYVGSANKDVLVKFKSSIEVILSPDIVNYLKYINSTGELQPLFASNPKTSELFNNSSSYSLTNLIRELKQSGWNIRKESSLDELNMALQTWGIDEINDENLDGGVEVVEEEGLSDDELSKLNEMIFGPEEEPDDFEADLLRIDDKDLEMELGDPDISGSTGETQGENLGDPVSDQPSAEPQLEVHETPAEPDAVAREAELANYLNSNSGYSQSEFDVSTARKSVVSDDDDGEDLLDPVQYNEKLLEAEKASASTTNEVGDKIGTDQEDTHDYAKDTADSTDEDVNKLTQDDKIQIDGLVESMLQRIEGTIRSCFELDKPYGVMTSDGLIKYHKDKATNTLVFDKPRPQDKFSEMAKIYQAIVQSAGVELTKPPSSKYMPNYSNISGTGEKGSITQTYNYYPAQMLRYALGFVDSKQEKCKSWSTFRKALKKSLVQKMTDFFTHTTDEGYPAYYQYERVISQIYGNNMLVLDYSPSGITIRISLVGMNSDVGQNIERTLKAMPTMTNCSISVFNVSDRADVVDVQIIRDFETVMGKPAWAYKALKVRLDNGDAPSLLTGLPIGKKVNGEIIDFQLVPDKRFMIFVAAGSGAGKGVLTLSLAAAAMGSGIPIFYTDFKPDMAPIFWEMSESLGVETYSFDANVKTHKNIPGSPYVLGGNIPHGVRTVLVQHAGALLYLRSLALMCAMAGYRSINEIATPNALFIFDEIQAMQRCIINAVKALQLLYDENKPDGKKDSKADPDVFNYCKKILTWITDLDQELSTYTVTTGRKSGIFSMFIGQNAAANFWDKQVATVKLGKQGAQVSFFAQILKAGTVTKLLGKGTGQSEYGLGGADITKEEKTYINEYRYFALYDGATTKGANVNAFKPFLTLNYDDIFARCWTSGVGRSYGYQKPPGDKPTRDEMIACNTQYIQNMREAFPGGTVNADGTIEQGSFSNEFGVHVGVGLKGLASMYCGGNVENIKNALQGSWNYANKFFEQTGLINKWSTPADYLYDMSESAWLVQKSMIEYRPGEDDAASSPESIEDDGYTGLNMGTSEPQGDLAPNPQITNQAVNEVINQYSQSSQPSNITPEMQKMMERARQQQELERQRQQQAQESQQFQSAPIPGQQIPGQQIPGQQIPGQQIPGQQIPGQQIPGQQILGAESTEDMAGNAQQYNTNSTQDFNEQQLDSDQPYDMSQHQAEPDYMSPSQHQTFQSGGATSRCYYATPERTTNVLGLTKDNSILVTMPPYTTAEKFNKKLFSTIWGSQYEFKNRWATILASAASNQKPSTVSRLTIMEDAIVFNKKYIATIGILGGDEDIRIEDIVNFTMTAKKYRNIRDLMIDTTIFEAAQREFGDPVAGLFKVFPSLTRINVMTVGCGGVAGVITRQEYEAGIQNQQMQEASARATFKNQMETVIAAKNPNLRTKSPGYQNRVWSTAKSLSGNQWNAARGALMEKNPRLFKATMLTGASLFILTVGGIGSLAGRVGSLFTRK